MSVLRNSMFTLVTLNPGTSTTSHPFSLSFYGTDLSRFLLSIVGE